MRQTLALLAGKAIATTIRKLRLGGASAAPGLYTLKIYPNLIQDLIGRIPVNILVTGTNGKTTTARMLAHFAKSQGLRVIRNHTGSNLERGIASTLLSHSSLFTLHSPLLYDLGIWEADEAAFNSLALKIKPQVVVFLNVFRDQLDRYGEVDSVVKRWSETLKLLDPDTTIIVNGDDLNTRKLSQSFKGRTLTFGIKDYQIKGEAIEIKKSAFKPDFLAQNVNLNGLLGSKFQLPILHALYSIPLPLPGLYHIYDFLAAFVAGFQLKLDPKKIVGSLKDFSPAFGRVEKIKLGGRECYIFLIKNPAGATQVLQTISSELKPQDALMFALNDNIADGTDVSWIWDVKFEKLSAVSHQLSITVSGTRAEDLALRLKYAGINPSRVRVEKSLFKALQTLKEGRSGRLFILPTYTALLQLQTILAKMGVKANYWED